MRFGPDSALECKRPAFCDNINVFSAPPSLAESPFPESPPQPPMPPEVPVLEPLLTDQVMSLVVVEMFGEGYCGENVVVISSDKVEGSEDWNSPEFQDTANRGKKKEMKSMVFYQMNTEVSDRFVAPCFVNVLEAYDGEINLGVEENMISNEYASEKDEEEAVKRIKGEALKEKHDPGVFIFPIRLEGHVNENALADTGSDINTTPYRIYEQLGREEMKKVDRGITMINHTQAEAMRILTNVLCQVGVTTLIARFLILDIPIDRDAPIDFFAAKFDVMRNAESDSDDEEEYQIKRNKFGAPIYGRSLHLNFLGSLPVPLKHVNWKSDYKGCCTKEEEASTKIRLWEHMMMRPDHQDSNALDKMKPWKRMGCDGEIDDMLRIRLHKDGSNEEIFTSEHNFEGDSQDDHLWFVSEDDQFISKIAKKCMVLTKDVVRSLSSLIYCRDLDTITLRDLIDSKGKLILEDPQPGVPRVGIPRPLRASMQDLYDRMGRIEIRQEAIEMME
ncbi:hypothetical protein Tco_0593891 [Tanacetum coccineum]